MSKQLAAPAGAQTPQMTNGWDLFVPSMRVIGRNFWTLVGLFAIPLGGFVLTIGILYVLEKTHVPPLPATIVGLVFALASIATFLIVLPASTLTLIAGGRGKSVEIKEMLVAARPFIAPYVAVSIALVLMYAVGILVIVPYLFAMKYFMLAPYYVLDEGVAPIEAMRRSIAASKKYSKAMWSVVLVVVCFNAVEFVPRVGGAISVALSLLYAAAPVLRYLEIHDADASGTLTAKAKSTKKKKSPFDDQFGGKSTID